MEKLILIFVVACFDCSQSAVIPKSTIEREYSEPLSLGLDFQNIEGMSGKFDGDIILTEEQRSALITELSVVLNPLKNTKKLWPNKTIPFAISNNTFSRDQIDAIRISIYTIEVVSCVKFKDRTDESDYILITGLPNGCHSYVGKIGGPQLLNLAPSPVGMFCFRFGTIVHEFLHSIGFYDMENNYDRDNWAKTVWKNIPSAFENNFHKYTPDLLTNFGQIYDYGSILDYSESGLTVNGQKIIVPLKNTQNKELRQRWTMSKTEVIRLNRLYSC